MHAQTLVGIVEAYPGLRLVLSTSWVRMLTFRRAKRQLPMALQAKVIGATYHSQVKDWWSRATRYDQIARYLTRARPGDWLAIDDDPEGWPEEQRHHLILTDSMTGLGDPDVQATLLERLAKLGD